ncbi:hypothetical protein [Mycolicibacterium komossense]|uniref:Uncharacterized protein n=1 Tax=Mycolicibacterium komossense TaxID=1779 RepID=A0ABT3C6U0_9MYCO|nr:hypothetical protein [Mycolicibacterium komossense]MCV7225189.1 hypothetical protein [Mycolicibacterium komossense]
MTDTPDFDRLSRNWTYWSELALLGDISTSTSCPDCAVRFSSDQYSVHLRFDGSWWIVDTVDDRNQRHDDTAKFSSYALAEKYLVWIWASAARSVVRAPSLGPALYGLGFASDVNATPISAGIYELRSTEGSAVLMEPYATIISHLIHKSQDEIEQMVRTGV